MWSVIHATRTQVEGALFSWEWSDLQKDTTLTANQFESALETLCHIEQPFVTHLQICEDFKQKLLAWNDAWHVIFSMKGAPLRERHWREIFEYIVTEEGMKIIEQLEYASGDLDQDNRIGVEWEKVGQLRQLHGLDSVLSGQEKIMFYLNNDNKYVGQIIGGKNIMDGGTIRLGAAMNEKRIKINECVEKCVRQAMRGSLQLQILFTLCNKDIDEFIKNVVEKSIRQQEVRDQFMEIVHKWSKAEVPIYYDEYVDDVRKGKYQKYMNQEEENDDAQKNNIEEESESSTISDKSESKQQGKKKKKIKQADQKKKKNQRKQNQLISFPKVNVQKVSMLSAETVIDFMEIGKMALKSMHQGIIPRNALSKQVMEMSSRVGLKLRSLRTLNDKSSQELIKQMEDINKQYVELRREALKTQMRYIAPAKPRFLKLTITELIEFSSCFNQQTGEFEISPGILNQFLPGARRLELKLSQDERKLMAGKLEAVRGDGITLEGIDLGIG
ncbi:MAG: hypothetical protein EZS28_042627, partial [Streblomastix strix]